MKLKYKQLILAAAFTVLIIGSISGFVLIRNDSKDTLKDIRARVPYALYQPKSGYGQFTVDRKSVSVSEEVVTYQLIDSSNQTIYVSQQRKPENFDYQAFHSAHFRDRQEFTNSDGFGAFGQMVMGGYAGSFVGGSTWVLITGANQNATAIEDAIQNLSL